MLEIDLSNGFGQGAVNNLIGWGKAVTTANEKGGNNFGILCIRMQIAYFSSISTNLTGSLSKPPKPPKKGK